MTPSLRVLIVDDCEDDARLVVRRIEKAGYGVAYQCVATAPTMAAALHEHHWDAVISDVSMPSFSATGALTLYKEMGCTCPFIAMSGVIGEDTAVSLLKAGAHDFVLKSNLARLVPALEREWRDAEIRKAKVEAEEALRRSEERYALAAKGANDGLWDWDLDTGQVFYSERWREMLGLGEVEVGQGIGEWMGRIHPDDAEAVRAALDAHLAGTTPQFAIEHRVLHTDGQWRWVLARGMAMRGPDGPRRIVGSLTDTTAYRLAEEGLRRAKDEADRALAAKTRFLAAASHDLRQPIQALFCFCSLLVSALEDHPAGEVARDLEDSLSSLKALLDSLLDISKLDAGLVQADIRPTPLKELIDQMTTEMGPVAHAKGLELRAVDCDCTTVSDPVLLGRIVRNLLENAIRYTDRGKVLLGCRHRGDKVAITVADTGIGMEPDHLKQIFEEFFQVGNPERDRRKGLGVGLAIVDRLARVLGHHIEVKSSPGCGSTFTVVVPKVARSRTPQPAEAETLHWTQAGA